MPGVKPHPPGSRAGGPGKWRAWVSLGKDPVKGKYVYKTKVFEAKGKKDAEDKRAAWKAELEGSIGRNVSSVTFSHLLDRYLEANPDDLRDTTLRTYARYAEKHIRPIVGKAKLVDLTTKDFAELRQHLGRSLKPSSVNQCLAVCRSACRYGEEGLGWLKSNPAEIRRAKMSKAKVESTDLDDYRALVAKLRAAGDLRTESFVQVAAYTGARRGELCGLRWGDLRNGELTIERGVDERRKVTPTKTHQSRTIPLQEGCLAILFEWQQHVLAEMAKLEPIDRRALDDDWYIWSEPSNPTLPEFPEKWTKAMQQFSGGKVKLHGLRHLAATLMIGSGIDARAAADRLGHSSPTMTADVYAASSTDRDRAAGDSIGNALAP